MYEDRQEEEKRRREGHSLPLATSDARMTGDRHVATGKLRGA